MTDSIKYAEQIQKSMLPDEETIRLLVPNSFIFYKAKDIVSGDFYFFEKRKSEFDNEDLIYFIAADATGHGVPGAFMSILGLSLIKAIFQDNHSPSQFINILNSTLFQHLHKNNIKNDSLENLENIDLAYCCINQTKLMLQFLGANRPCYIIRDGDIIELKRDLVAIGEHSNILNKIRLQEYQLQKEDMIYIFTDGYISQFGDKENKKINKSKFKDLLISISKLSLGEQKIMLETVLNKWKGELEQTDDILVIGYKVG